MLHSISDYYETFQFFFVCFFLMKIITFLHGFPRSLGILQKLLCVCILGEKNGQMCLVRSAGLNKVRFLSKLFSLLHATCNVNLQEDVSCPNIFGYFFFLLTTFGTPVFCITQCRKHGLRESDVIHLPYWDLSKAFASELWAFRA